MIKVYGFSCGLNEENRVFEVNIKLLVRDHKDLVAMIDRMAPGGVFDKWLDSLSDSEALTEDA